MSEIHMEELNLELSETYPVLRDELVIEPVEGAPGEFRIVGEENIVLGEAALAIARQFDGSRTCAQITKDFEFHDVALPSDDFIEAMAAALARAGIVRMVVKAAPSTGVKLPDHPVSLHMLSHQCVGCGRSCQGHVVGPLSEAYVEKLQGLHDELVKDFPELEGLSPIRVEKHKSTEVTALAVREDGTCIYLGDDKLCRIHKKFGSAAKPMVCRLYPLNLVQTEDQVRIGTPLRCYMHHKTYKNGQALSPVELTGMEPEEFPASTRRGMDANNRTKVLALDEVDGVYLRTLRVEEMLLRLLGNEEITLEALWKFTYEVSMGERMEEMRPLTGDSPFIHELTSRFNRMGARQSTGLRHIFDISEEVSHAAEIEKLAHFMRDLKPRDFKGLTAAQKDFGLYVMREWFFLREWVLQPSLYVALPLCLAGLMISSWRAEAEGDEDSGPEGNQVSDTFAFSLATWMRLVRIGTNLVMMIRNGEEFQTLMAPLSVDWTPGEDSEEENSEES